MPGTTENLIQGVGFLYLAPVGTTEPADSAITTEPASAWRGVGFTKEGVALTVSQEYQELDVDQLVDIPGRRLIKREVKIVTSLAEATLENLAEALNALANVEDTAAGAATPGLSVFEPTSQPSELLGEPDYVMALFDGFAPGGFPRRVILRRALQVGELEMKYAKDGQVVYPVEFAGHFVSNEVAPYKVVDQTAAPTGD